MLKKKGFILLGMMCLLGILAAGELTAAEEKKREIPRYDTDTSR